MPPKPRPVPTKAELEILQVLWRRSSATVREVHEEMGRAMGYTTVLKFLQIMTEKGLVVRQNKGRAHVYEACISEKRGMADFMKELIGRFFGGSASRLALQALGTGQTSKKELVEIRKMLEELEHRKP